jgi:hypothetical protein
MTDQISFPPLHDPAPGELERRKQHLLSEISREPERGLLWLPSIPPFRLRFALPAIAVVCAAVGAVITTNVIGGSHESSLPRTGTTQSGVSRGLPPFLPLTVSFTRSGQTVTSIAVSVKSGTADAALQLQVVHSDASEPQQATNDPTSQVVFQKQLPMTNTGSAAPETPLSEWSGTLSPSDWTGGCADGLYSIRAVVVPSGSSYDNPSPGSSNAETAWFTCTGT